MSTVKSVNSDANEDPFETNHDETIDTFDAMKLKPALLQGIYALGYERPTAIQSRVIMPVLNGLDVIAQAGSLTGRTVAFSIPIIQRMNIEIKACQALILAPTLVRAQRINKFIADLGDSLGIRCRACIGGVSRHENKQALDEGPQVVVGTPGRIQDMIQRQYLNIDSIKTFVLDDVDEMLARGFSEQIYDIFQILPQSTQHVLLSATVPQDVLELTTKFMRDRDPVRVLMKKEISIFEGMKQFYVSVEDEDSRFDTLFNLCQSSTSQAIVFCNLRKKLEWLSDELTRRGCTVSAMHGDMTAILRAELMDKFKSGTIRVLLVTNLLARGLTGIQGASLIINYDLPAKPEDYIYRIARDGRHRREGVTINISTADEIHMVRGIEQFHSTQIQEMPENVTDLTQL